MKKEELTKEEKDLLFSGLFRHIERNLDWEHCYSDEEMDKAIKAYKKLMNNIFGSCYRW